MIKAYIILGIGLLLILLSLGNRNNKLLTQLIYIYLFIVYSFCNGGTPDLEVYKWTYTEGIKASFFGFDFLMVLFSSLGIPFVFFKMFCGVITIFFLRKAFKLFLIEENAALALCIVYPFFGGISQIKNGMMAAIVLYAIMKFLKDPDHKIVPYIIMILCASLIHMTALVYLIFVLAKRKMKQTYILIPFIGILMVIFVEIVISQNLLYGIASKLISNEHYLAYFDFKTILDNITDEVLNIKGKLMPVFGQLSAYAIVVYLAFTYRVRFHSDKVVKESGYHFPVFSEEQLKMIKAFFQLSMFLLPFYQMNPTYFRILKNITPIIFIMAAHLIGRKDGKNSFILDPVIPIVYLGALSALALTVYSSGYFMTMLNSFSLFG